MESLAAEIVGAISACLPLKDSMRLCATSKTMKHLASDLSYRDELDLSPFFTSVRRKKHFFTFPAFAFD
jgi:hypothetical protein